MQKRILSLFAPFLIAIMVRVFYVLWGYGLYCVGYVSNEIQWAKSNMNSTGFFDTFSWDESWHYWGLVLILTFLVEMDIWREEDNEEDLNWFQRHSIYALVFLGLIVLLLIPSLTSFLYTLPVSISNLFASDKPTISVTLYVLFNEKENLELISNLFWANVGTTFIFYILDTGINDDNSTFWIWAAIVGGVFYFLPLFPIDDLSSGFIALNILFYIIYFILFCIYSVLK